MDEDSKELACKFVPESYVVQGFESKVFQKKRILHLLNHRKWPVEGWSELDIERLISDLSVMDSNNFHSNCGLGEREARIASNIVRRRHFNLGHGIGRSGELSAPQPKAAGSSILAGLANDLALDAIRTLGIPSTRRCLIMPVATGMAIVMTLLSLRCCRPKAKYVLWSRIDQKSCFKAIITAGFVPIIIENKVDGDQLVTDLSKMEELLEEISTDEICCILTTTSCFAPRVPDRIEEVSILCEKFDVYHVVNNAYGLQSTKCTHLIEQSNKKGRLDVFVQSTDKNFLVPVGGSIVAGFNKELIDIISKTYPGRASVNACLDLTITLLEIGSARFLSLRTSRKEMFAYLKERLTAVATSYGEKVLDTKHNPISIAMTVKQFENPSELGAMLFKCHVSGTRVVDGRQIKTISSYEFNGFGAHHDAYLGCPYLTAAAAIGVTKEEVDIFINRLVKCVEKLKHRNIATKSNSS